MHSVEIYFLLFMTYAMIGWCMEVTCKLFEFKRFINRGFLIGPYCPIYGFGAILITLLLERYTYDPLVLFVFAIIICSILEYTTSYILEKIFHARWWDYSTRKFNINGRICMRTMIPFGLLGLLMMYFINPTLITVYKSIGTAQLSVISFILFLIFIVDVVISTTVLVSVRKENKVLDRDNTEEMSKKVHAILASKGVFYKRFNNAYPNVRHIGSIMKNNFNKAKSNFDYRYEKIMQKNDEKVANLKYEYNEKIKKVEKKTEKKLSKYKKER